MVLAGEALAVLDLHHLPGPRMERIEDQNLERRTPGIVTLPRAAWASRGYPAPWRRRLVAIDNARMAVGGWACEAGCFANNPQPDLSEGLGTLEIKAESMRYVVCATSDLLQDAAFNVESWLLDKVSEGFRMTLNAAILLGDGVGKPLGLLNPPSGIPICDVSASTPPA
jgi:hypothetical protein